MSSSDWKEIELERVINFYPKESIKKGEVAKKVSMDKLDVFNRKINGYEKCAFSGGTKFKNGDTLLARITPCLENGKTAQVSILDENEIGFGSTEFIVMREKSGITDNNFIYYLAISPEFRSIAIKSMTGTSGRQRVQSDVLQKSKILLPPLEEQKAIANILSSLDKKIELNNQMNRTLEEMARALFKRWFVDFEFPNEEGEPYKSNGGEMVDSELGMIPKGWKVENLDSVANIVMGQSPAGSSYNEEKIGEVFYQGRGEFGKRYPKIRLYTSEPKRMADIGDILLSVRAPVGDLNVAHEKCCIGRGLAAIQSKENNKSFILYTMINMKKQLDVYNGEGTVFGSINSAGLKNLKVCVPNKKYIEKFEQIVGKIDKRILSNHDEMCNLQETRDTLLPKLMSGEIRVKDLQI